MRKRKPRGKNIRDILKDPATENRRREAVSQGLQGNTNRFVHGQLSKREKPLICSASLCPFAGRCNTYKEGQCCEKNPKMKAILDCIRGDALKQLQRYADMLDTSVKKLLDFAKGLKNG